MCKYPCGKYPDNVQISCYSKSSDLAFVLKLSYSVGFFHQRYPSLHSATMIKLFEDLHFDVDVHEEKTAADINNLIADYASRD